MCQVTSSTSILISSIQFLNQIPPPPDLYNILTIHAILIHEPMPESTISVPSFWQRYAYKVGPYTLHLDHMEHGILRGWLMITFRNFSLRSYNLTLRELVHFCQKKIV